MKKYNVIYADPPWQFKTSRAGRGFKHGAGKKYSVEGNNTLSVMPLNEMTQENCVLFMWATVPLLPEALELMSAWGFTYKTTIVWEKTGLLGMGYWTRVQTEFLLVGIKGTVKAFRNQDKNIYKQSAGKHSQKPHFFRTLVERLAKKSFPELTKLEMFARTREGIFGDWEYEGWDVYGNQVNNSITLPNVGDQVA